MIWKAFIGSILNVIKITNSLTFLIRFVKIVYNLKKYLGNLSEIQGIIYGPLTITFKKY